MRTATPKFDRIASDESIETDWLSEAVRLLKPTGALYIATRWDVFGAWQTATTDTGLKVKDCVVWHKGGGGMGDLTGSFAPEHEFWIFAHTGQHKIRGKRDSNVWYVPKDPPSSYQHPTQKPLDLMKKIIAKSTDEGDLILDPFMGAGTTLRAAKDLGRRAIGIELEEKYCEVAVNRLAQMCLL